MSADFLKEGNVMKVFIWRELDKVTQNYHSQAGAVAIAASLERARELFSAEPEFYLTADSALLKADPDVVTDCADGVPEFVQVFPNAGCC